MCHPYQCISYDNNLLVNPLFYYKLNEYLNLGGLRGVEFRIAESETCSRIATYSSLLPVQTSSVQYIIVHYTTLNYTTPQYTTLHHTTLHYTTLYFTIVQYGTARYSTLQ